MNKLTTVRNALETNPDIIVVDVTEKIPPLGKSWWVQIVDFTIAPKKGRYTADELQTFMMGLVPGLEPEWKDDFNQSSDELGFGRLNFEEELNGRELQDVLKVSFLDEKRTIDGQKRRIRVSLYPDEWIARAGLEDRGLSPTYRVRFKDIKKYQPDYEPSFQEKLIEKMKKIEAKRRNFLRPFHMQLFDSIMTYKWKMTSYERDMLFTLVITDKCTLRCEHCFEEAGPENNNFLDKDRVDELIEESVGIFRDYKYKTIRVTGGDPFLHPDLPEIIESFSKRKDRLGYSGLDVETNGWFAKDKEETEKRVKMLKEAGATLLSMTLDYWHCKQNKFDGYEHFERISKIAKEQGLKFRNIKIDMPLSNDDEEIKKEEEKHEYCCQDIPQVTPIGRARSLPEKYWGNMHIFCLSEGCRLSPPTLCRIMGEYMHTDEITIEPDGNVYPCNSGKKFENATLAIGNIYEESLPRILEKQDNPLVQLLREKGLRALTKKAGLSLRRHWEMYEKLTPCGLCHEMLREYGEKIAAGV